MNRTALFIVVTIFLLLPSQSFANCYENNHAQHSLFCPDASINLFGAGYNPKTENWGWHMGVKTVLFHPIERVWVGGLGLGIAFDQSSSVNRGAVPVVTLIPLQIGAFSVEVSLNQVKSQDNQGLMKRGRLIVLAWNWF